MKRELRYGKNLDWFLSELSSYDNNCIEQGVVEIYGEDENGTEGSCEIDIPELAADALQVISELRDQLTQRDAQIAALIAENESNLKSAQYAAETNRKVVKKNGELHDELVVTKAQLAALIAENVALKDAVKTHSESVHFCELCGKDDPCATDDVCMVLGEIPATDAAANALRAEGVEIYGNLTIEIGKEEDDSDIIYAGKQALLYANQLREGK